ISPDGFSRSSIVINGKFPAPLIKGNKGDRFLLNVIDRLTDASMLRAASIYILCHSYLFFLIYSHFADSMWNVECPIVPDHPFLYDFSTPNQMGTFWYHSHFGYLALQYCDGLRGPLVIYDRNDPLAYLYGTCVIVISCH
ncbi:Cupredoxin, partial [Mycena rebaudengoi]